MYVNFAKEFDTDSHKELIIKLQAYGIRGTLLFWLNAFLSNRFQRVKLGSIYSSWLPVTSGVPQGSVLGPILFLLFVNDLPDIVEPGVIIKLFADDLKIYAPSSLVSCLHSSLRTLESWTSLWQLKISVPKCLALPIGSARRESVDFSLNSTVIDRVELCRDLGVVISNNMKFTDHYIAIVNKANKLVAMLFRSFRSNCPRTFVFAFNTYVRPILEYCSPVWNPCYLQDISQLESVQKSFTRRLFARCGFTYVDYESRLRRLDMISLAHRRRLADLVLCYQIRSGNISVNSNIFSVSTHNPNRIICEHARVNCRSFFFAHRVVGDWNRLNVDINVCRSLTMFKTLLADFNFEENS
ncbi:MAG: hypothetical protein GY820_07145 [Gammaproteobacteria bacterium]|nr:hypothetical protein [Gammaproteobacteria bacterium]